MRIFGVLLGLLSIAAPAGAVQVGFDSFGGEFAFVGPTYAEQGFNFSNPGGGTGSMALFTWGQEVRSADASGNTLNINYPGTVTTVTRADGGLFRFSSIDLTGVFNESIGGSVLFTFVGLTGSTTKIVTLDALPGFQTFTLNRTRLLSASYVPISTNGLWVQADNFVFEEVSAIPEPASWSLLIAGFALSGAALRRRRAVVC